MHGFDYLGILFLSLLMALAVFTAMDWTWERLAERRRRRIIRKNKERWK